MKFRGILAPGLVHLALLGRELTLYSSTNKCPYSNINEKTLSSHGAISQLIIDKSKFKQF
jgi:hypothetical protein